MSSWNHVAFVISSRCPRNGFSNCHRKPLTRQVICGRLSECQAFGTGKKGYLDIYRLLNIVVLSRRPSSFSPSSSGICLGAFPVREFLALPWGFVPFWSPEVLTTPSRLSIALVCSVSFLQWIVRLFHCLPACLRKLVAMWCEKYLSVKF